MLVSSSSEDELPSAENLLSNVITVSSDEMSEDNEDKGEASGEASVSNSESHGQLSMGSRDTSEPNVRSTGLSTEADVNLQHCSDDHPQLRSSASENEDGEAGKLKLQEVFIGRLSAEQTDCVFKISGENFTSSMDCLLTGPTLESLLMILNKRFAEQPVIN